MRRSFLLGFLFWTCAAAFAQDEAPAPVRHELWFPVGEQTTYDIRWGVFHVGQTVVTTAWTNRDGRDLLHIKFRTRSNRVIEKLYPVDDTIESYIEPESFLPVYFAKRLREGRYRCDEETVFDHEKGEMRWHSNLNGKKKTLPIEPNTRDIVSLMYYLRRDPFELNVTNDYRVMADEKMYDLTLKADALETIDLGDLGKRSSYRIEPTAAFNGLFVRKGRMIFWVSADDRRICTKLLAEVPVANVRLILSDIKGPGAKEWSKAKP